MLCVFSVKRVREKYEAELRECERSEQEAMEKQQEMKKRLIEMDGELFRLQALLTQKEQQLTDITQVHEQMLIMELLRFSVLEFFEFWSSGGLVATALDYEL